jgi:hypothetical protein
MGSRRIRVLRAVALTLICALAWPAAAAAHGGRLAFTLRAGPYAVQAYVSRADTSIDETLLLTDAAGGRPISGGVVLLTLENERQASRGPFTGRLVGGGFEVLFPPPSGSGWTIAIEIQGPLGPATASHPYVAPESGAGDWAVLAAALLALVVAPFLARRWWRGRHRSEQAEPEATSRDGRAR